MRRHFYTLAVSASIFALCAAFSPGANAITIVSIINQAYSGDAPQEGDAAPLASPAPVNFEQGVTGKTQVGLSSSPYVANSNYTGVGDSWLYNVISSGAPGPGSAVYNVGASTYSILWGTPDTYNQIKFYDGPGGSGNLIGTFIGSDLGCYSLTDANNCNGNRYDLVTFGVNSGVIGSVVLSDTTGSAAFEFGTVATPLPAALPLFATGLAGLGLLGWRRKRKAAATTA